MQEWLLAAVNTTVCQPLIATSFERLFRQKGDGWGSGSVGFGKFLLLKPGEDFGIEFLHALGTDTMAELRAQVFIDMLIYFLPVALLVPDPFTGGAGDNAGF